MTPKTVVRFLKYPTRNRLVVSFDEYKNLSYTDIGTQLSNALVSCSNSEKISLFAQSELEKIMNHSFKEHSDLGSYVAIKNLGILLEPELKLDITAFLSRYSASNPLFIHWKGTMKQNKLHFLTAENGVTINLDNISHIIA